MNFINKHFIKLFSLYVIVDLLFIGILDFMNDYYIFGVNSFPVWNG